MIFTYFLNPAMIAYDDKELPDPGQAPHWTMTEAPDDEPRYNVKAQLRKQITLDDTDTHTLNYRWPKASRTILHFKVKGKCTLTLGGDDLDGGAITSIIPFEGNGIWTGMGIIVTKDLDAAPIFTGLADGTIVDIFAAEVIADDDPAIISNA